MRAVLACFLLVLAAGCVSTQPVALDTPEGRARINDRAARSAATLYVDGEPARPVRGLRIDAEEATWTDRLTGTSASAPTARVRAVAFPNSRRSVARTAAVGAAVGTTFVLAAHAAGRRPPACNFVCFSRAFHLFAETFAGAFTGGLGGFVVGTQQATRFVPTPDVSEPAP